MWSLVRARLLVFAKENKNTKQKYLTTTKPKMTPHRPTGAPPRPDGTAWCCAPRALLFNRRLPQAARSSNKNHLQHRRAGGWHPRQQINRDRFLKPPDRKDRAPGSTRRRHTTVGGLVFWAPGPPARQGVSSIGKRSRSILFLVLARQPWADARAINPQHQPVAREMRADAGRHISVGSRFHRRRSQEAVPAANLTPKPSPTSTEQLPRLIAVRSPGQAPRFNIGAVKVENSASSKNKTKNNKTKNNGVQDSARAKVGHGVRRDQGGSSVSLFA